MKLADMLPAIDERAFITGKSKSGKSTLVRQLIGALPDDTYILVIDSKHEWKIKLREKLGNHPVHRILVPNIHLIRRPGIYVYQSKYPHFYDPKVTRLLLGAYNRKNFTVVIHEGYHFCHGNNPLPALGQIATMGRAKNCRLFYEAQRPSNIPLIFITEANVWIEMRLQKPEDRQKVADNAGFPEMIKPVRAAHDFWVAKDDWDNAVYIENTKAA
jgi:energy-coupling factor transporter ATP-binding protein EcfA2